VLAKRLDFTQAFNSLGTTVAPKLGGLLILSAAPLAIEQLQQLAPQALQAYRVQQAASVKLPYVVIGVALTLLAVLIAKAKLPKLEIAKNDPGQKGGDSAWRHPNLVFGAAVAGTNVKSFACEAAALRIDAKGDPDETTSVGRRVRKRRSRDVHLDLSIMKIEPWNKRKGVGVETSVGAGLTDLEGVTAAESDCLHGHIAGPHE